MPKRKPTSDPAKLSFDPFFGKKWAPRLRSAQEEEKRPKGVLAAPLGQWDGEAPEPLFLYKHSPEMWKEVANWWPFQFLREAAVAGDSEAYKRLLMYFLSRLDAYPPKQVLKPLSAPPGAPKKDQSAILAEWFAIRRRHDQKPTRDELDEIANKLDHAEFKKEPKKVKDRIRKAILDATKSSVPIP